MAPRPTLGNVARIGLDAGETMRRTEASRTRTAKQLGQAVAMWDHAGEVDRSPRWNG